MNQRNTFRSAFVLATLCAAAATAFAQGAAAPSKSGARKGYKTAAQHEAAAARGSKFSQQNDERYMRNALARCQRLPEGYKQACEERVRGAGTHTGSVEGGGILHENEVRGDLLPSSGQTMPSQPQPVQAKPMMQQQPMSSPDAGATLMNAEPEAQP
ncbi:MAG: hypothetical protein Q4A28_08165 [Brachymonas sp.]|nr:hypothetical protein [Brachymonas sp.]